MGPYIAIVIWSIRVIRLVEIIIRTVIIRSRKITIRMLIRTILKMAIMMTIRIVMIIVRIGSACCICFGGLVSGP